MEPLIALPPDSLANPLASRASAEVRLILAGSGPKSYGLFRSTNPLGSFLKMLLASSAWDLTPYSAIWTLRATKRGRLYFRLRLSARRMSGNASSLWPTPTVNGNDNRKGASASSGDGLSTAVKMWPTPTATDAGTGRINRSASPGAAARPTLALLVAPRLWSTPAAQDGKNATCPASPATRSLNPEWVETLMGFPEGWTALDEPVKPPKPMRSPRRATPGLPSEVKRSTPGNRRARRKSASLTAQRG